MSIQEATMKAYIPRLIDDTLSKELEAFGAVLITGPKWCGKTTTALQQANSTLFLQDPDNRRQYLQLADTKPSLLLEGAKPRLLDEWQDAPQLWDAVRHSVDREQDTGLYILTGSTTIDEEKIVHSGTGRISRVRMRTMSLYEAGESNGQVSLKSLFEGENITSQSDHSLEDVAALIVRGGWPGSMGRPLEVARRQVAGYCQSIINTEIESSDGKKRDRDKLTAFLRSYSRHTAGSASINTLVRDVSQQFDTISRKTISEYLSALSKIYVIEELPAWSPALRSKTSIAKSPIRHFVDPAIAAYFLDAGPADLISDLRTYGLLLESLVVRDLRIYADSINGKVYHYRDSSGLEADAIIHLNNGSWGAVEVKLGNEAIEKGAASLLSLKSKINTDKMKEPSFLAVITSSGYAYEREDGVYVLPITCLRD